MASPDPAWIRESIHSDDLSADRNERPSAVSGLSGASVWDVVDALKRPKRGKYAGSRRRLTRQVESETDREQALGRVQGASVRPVDGLKPCRVNTYEANIDDLVGTYNGTTALPPTVSSPRTSDAAPDNVGICDDLAVVNDYPRPYGAGLS